MSAIFSAATDHAVFVLTDGAVYDSDNRLTAIRRKVAVSTSAPIAVATRGHVAFGDYIAGKLIDAAERTGFDAMVRDLELVMHKFALADDWDNSIEVLIAGMSETAGPVHLVFRNRPWKGQAGKPMMISHPGEIYIGVASDGRDDGLAAMGLPPPAPGEGAEGWLAKHGRAIFDFYRRCPVPPGASDSFTEAAYLIGGQLDMTVVDRAGARVRTLHRWPEDKVGERINPFAGQNVTPLASNRQQRRAAERATRKGRAA